MCKELGVPVLLSAPFADSFNGKLLSFGEHQLRGIEAKQELFTLPPENAFEPPRNRRGAADAMAAMLLMAAGRVCFGFVP